VVREKLEAEGGDGNCEWLCSPYLFCAKIMQKLGTDIFLLQNLARRSSASLSMPSSIVSAIAIIAITIDCAFLLPN
jgi:hypothetical protein